MYEYEDEEFEILRLSKTVYIEKDVWVREWSFASDHQVFTKVTHNGSSIGWQKFGELWKDLKAIYKMAAAQETKGWDAMWHPAYAPNVSVFVKEVKF